MKKVKLLVLISVYLFVITNATRAQTQVTVTAITKEMSKGAKPGYKVNIPENSIKDVKPAWEKLLRENSKGKMQNVNAETSMTGAVTLLLSASPINIYSQMEEADGQVIIYAYFELTEGNFVNSASGDKDAGAQKYLHDFATRLFRASVQKMTDDEMHKLLDAEHTLNNKLHDEQQAKLEIITLNAKIKRAEEQNVFIKKEQEFTDQQIARQQDLIDKSSNKTDEITGKIKGKAEGATQEAQRTLENLQKQKVNLDKDFQRNILDANLDRDKIKDREKNIERAIKEQTTQTEAVKAQKTVVEKLLAKLATIK